MQTHAARRFLSMVFASGVAVAVALALPGGVALASPQVTMPAGNPQNNQTWTVSGSGFPSHHSDPTGVQILECADPHGTVANLPIDASTCDGATQDPLPVNTDASGNFTDRFTFVELSGVHGASNITCNATHACVLWVGLDYNNRFLGGAHAFSAPFEIGAASTSAGGSNAAVIAIPIAVIVIGAGVLLVLRRRRSQTPPPGRSSPSQTRTPPVRA